MIGYVMGLKIAFIKFDVQLLLTILLNTNEFARVIIIKNKDRVVLLNKK